MSEVEMLADGLGTAIFNEIRGSVGEDRWDSLSGGQKDTIKTIARKVMEYRLKVQLHPTDENKQLLETYESAVLDWRVWGEMWAEDAFWEGVARVGNALGSFLGAAATEALGRIVPGF